jgi:hypothetical protein
VEQLKVCGLHFPWGKSSSGRNGIRGSLQAKFLFVFLLQEFLQDTDPPCNQMSSECACECQSMSHPSFMGNSGHVASQFLLPHSFSINWYHPEQYIELCFLNDARLGTFETMMILLNITK